MKRSSIYVLLAFALECLALSAEASYLRLAWDASVTDGCDYRLYAQSGTNIVRVETGIYTRATFGSGAWSWSFIPAYVCTGSVDVTTVIPVAVPCLLMNITSQQTWTCWGTTNDWK